MFVRTRTATIYIRGLKLTWRYRGGGGWAPRSMMSSTVILSLRSFPGCGNLYILLLLFLLPSDNVQHDLQHGSLITFLLLFILPSDNVQHDLQHGSLKTFPKEENLGNKRKPMHYCCRSASEHRVQRRWLPAVVRGCAWKARTATAAAAVVHGKGTMRGSQNSKNNKTRAVLQSKILECSYYGGAKLIEPVVYWYIKPTRYMINHFY